MIKTQTMDWKKLFITQPNRWLPVYNGSTLVEVHDTETGNVWFDIGNNRWMLMR
jgi:hypothetical protein